jgi:hypothetical protein
MPQPTTQAPLDFGDLTAEQITSSILGYLSAHGYEFWSQSNRGEYDPITHRWRLYPQARRGIPNIIGLRRADGRFIGVEFKAGTNRLRPEQISFLNQLKAADGLAFVAREFAGFVWSF